MSRARKRPTGSKLNEAVYRRINSAKRQAGPQPGTADGGGRNGKRHDETFEDLVCRSRGRVCAMTASRACSNRRGRLRCVNAVVMARRFS